jgi:hypothetical protein
MAVAELLKAAIAELGFQGHDPADLRGDNYVAAFAGILQRGARTWGMVAEAVAATPPDFKLAGELLRTKYTFENARSPEIASFEQDMRIAADSSALGHRSAGDAFLLTVGPLRQELYRAERAPIAAIEDVSSAVADLARLPGEAEALRSRADRARTSWGKRRLQQRAERLDARAADIAATNDERTRRAQQQVAEMVTDVSMTVELFDTTFGGTR